MAEDLNHLNSIYTESLLNSFAKLDPYESNRYKQPSMKKTTAAFTAQLVTYETTLPFKEVIARLDAEVNKSEAGGALMMKVMAAKTKKEIVDGITGALADKDFVYFFEMNHDKWMNIYHEAEDTPPAVVYTIGNPFLAETFMRHDIRAGYNIPPRLMVVHNANVSLTTVFYHLPSSLVMSDNEEVMRAMRVVDDKLERMITRVTAD
ncbi:hypothetical protein E4T56_gene11197 [Termitomyces sp. T112]|nr:hypothetical protein E4T56_gene11197 [Termitomyces sp. T112]